MNFKRGEKIHEGKAKCLYSVIGEEQLLWHEFKDSLTAFNAQKQGKFTGKGVLNHRVASLIFRFLKKAGLENHWVCDQGEDCMISSRLDMLKLEVVVRNVLAGSTAKKFNFEEGHPIKAPLIEFFYKDDSLGDPFISDEQALMLGVAKSQEDLDRIKFLALEVNSCLYDFFSQVGILLVDFKLEFGVNRQGRILLGDEISPDSCRLWDKQSGEKMDKDRFRRDLGRVREMYQEVYDRLESRWGAEL